MARHALLSVVHVRRVRPQAPGLSVPQSKTTRKGAAMKPVTDNSMTSHELQGLTESNASYCARVNDAVLKIQAHRWWLECDGERLRAARAAAKRRGIVVA